MFKSSPKSSPLKSYSTDVRQLATVIFEAMTHTFEEVCDTTSAEFLGEWERMRDRLTEGFSSTQGNLILLDNLDHLRHVITHLLVATAQERTHTSESSRQAVMDAKQLLLKNTTYLRAIAKGNDGHTWA